MTRQTRENLLQLYPSWNENLHDIVKVNYGDEPLIIYDQNEYEKYQALTGTMANIMCSYAYIYSQNGNFNVYRTLIGETYIKPNGTVLGGNINVKYQGVTNEVFLNRMYGYQSLDILRIGQHVTGFSNKDGVGSPSINSREMDKEVIEKILNFPLKDYGYGVQRFMETAREVYELDTTNYIMEKRFGMKHE